MARFRFMVWLAYWYSKTTTFEFEWDEGNLSKSLKKHGVGYDEVEDVFKNKLAIPLGRQESPHVDEERYCIVGPGREGKMFSIVFTLRGEKIRPISGRLASRKERRMYEVISKKISTLR